MAGGQVRILKIFGQFNYIMAPRESIHAFVESRFISTLHNILSNPEAAFPHKDPGSCGQWCTITFSQKTKFSILKQTFFENIATKTILSHLTFSSLEQNDNASCPFNPFPNDKF